MDEWFKQNPLKICPTLSGDMHKTILNKRANVKVLINFFAMGNFFTVFQMAKFIRYLWLKDESKSTIIFNSESTMGAGSLVLLIRRKLNLTNRALLL